ncbi:MAG: hypothetical protein HOH66_14335 [Rhodospirillaceae bacterium]|jgi:hypothetical protein|nr:hypothetical protein [Rhodospirillaceae bacterium]
MAALKAVVIIMGMLLLAGIAVIAFTIVNRSGDGAVEDVIGTDDAPRDLVEAFGALRLEGTAGCRIAESDAEGGRLIVRTEGAGSGCGRIHVLDLRTGRTLGTVETGGPN